MNDTGDARASLPGCCDGEAWDLWELAREGGVFLVAEARPQRQWKRVSRPRDWALQRTRAVRLSRVKGRVKPPAWLKYRAYKRGGETEAGEGRRGRDSGL